MLDSIRRHGWIILFLVFLCFGGCSTSPEPFEYETDREMKPGPGLFSGEDGVFTIYKAPDVAEKGGTKETVKEDQQ